jgi:hypothetical protein
MAVSLVELQTGGGQAASAFTKIHLSAKDLAGLPLDQAFVKISNSISKLPAGILQIDAAVKIFGKSGSDLLPLMKELSNGGFEEVREKLEKMGLVMSGETAAQAEVLNDEFKLLEKTVKADAMAFASGLLPSLSEVSRSMESTASSSKSFWKTMGEAAGATIEGINGGIRLLGASIGWLTNLNFSSISKLKASARQGYQALRETVYGPLEDAIAAMPEKVNKIIQEMEKPKYRRLNV